MKDDENIIKSIEYFYLHIISLDLISKKKFIADIKTLLDFIYEYDDTYDRSSSPKSRELLIKQFNSYFSGNYPNLASKLPEFILSHEQECSVEFEDLNSYLFTASKTMGAKLIVAYLYDSIAIESEGAIAKYLNNKSSVILRLLNDLLDLDTDQERILSEGNQIKSWSFLDKKGLQNKANIEIFKYKFVLLLGRIFYSMSVNKDQLQCLRAVNSVFEWGMLEHKHKKNSGRNLEI